MRKDGEMIAVDDNVVWRLYRVTCQRSNHCAVSCHARFNLKVFSMEVFIVLRGEALLQIAAITISLASESFSQYLLLFLCL